MLAQKGKKYFVTVTNIFGLLIFGLFTLPGCIKAPGFNTKERYIDFFLRSRESIRDSEGLKNYP